MVSGPPLLVGRPLTSAPEASGAHEPTHVGRGWRAVGVHKPAQVEGGQGGDQGEWATQAGGHRCDDHWGVPARRAGRGRGGDLGKQAT